MSRLIPILAAFAMALSLAAPAVAAQKTAVLLPGAGGAVPNDFLIRNRAAFEAAGWSTVIATDGGTAAAAANQARQGGGKVVVVAMSKGAVTLAAALNQGARFDGAAIVSGVLGQAMGALGGPGALPPRVLVVHNPKDECHLTTPAQAEQFVAWSGGKARLQWVDVAGPPVPKPCGPLGAHGFYRRDGAAVGAVLRFIGSI